MHSTVPMAILRLTEAHAGCRLTSYEHQIIVYKLFRGETSKRLLPTRPMVDGLQAASKQCRRHRTELRPSTINESTDWRSPSKRRRMRVAPSSTRAIAEEVSAWRIATQLAEFSVS